MGHGDIDGDREPQRREEQMEGGIYGLSIESNEFDVTMKHQWDVLLFHTQEPKHDQYFRLLTRMNLQ